jgi:hypothetical protein
MSDAPAKTYRVYAIINKGADKDGKARPDFWHNVGTAWPNRDGKGFNISLEVLPIPIDGVCKLVIREIEPKEADEEDAVKTKTAEKRKPR